MMQARYEPDNEGHFGLASACYCHFTSPIRRYADLVVHRSLKHALGLPLSGDPPDQPPDSGAAKPLTRSRLTGIAEHINETERTAADAEREMDKRLAVLFLQGREGESFDGVVSGLTEFGIFVELPSVMAEGMLRLAELTDDFYQYLPDKQEIRGSGSRRTFRLGQPIRVMLLGVHLERQEISLALAENESGGISLPGSGGRRRKQPARRSVSRK